MTKAQAIAENIETYDDRAPERIAVAVEGLGRDFCKACYDEAVREIVQGEQRDASN